MQSITDLIPAASKSQESYLQFVAAINQLVTNDFAKLVQLLYMIDVSEKKLKSVLQDQPDKDAASLIADLLIERQSQKNKITPPPSGNIPDDERW